MTDHATIVPQDAPEPERQGRPSQLYRHFSKNGKLIYIGVSLSTVARLSQHKDHSHWFMDIGRVEIERFASRQAALDAERAAIHTEKPDWNIHHKKYVPLPTPKTNDAVKQLTHRVVTLQPIYKLQDAASVLTVGTGVVNRLIEQNKIGCIELPPHREGGKTRIRITGWQLLEYIESLVR